jgi:hypothetical protein
MLTPGSGHGRSLRLAVVLTALIVLLSLVAFASRSGIGHSAQAQPTPGYVSWAVSIFLVVLVLMTPFAAYVYWMQMREFRAQSSRSFEARVARSFAVIMIFVFVGGAITYFRAHRALFASGFHIPGLAGAEGSSGRHGTQRANPTFQWPVLWATLVLLAASSGWMWWSWRKRAGLAAFAAVGPSVEADVAASIGDAIDDLEAEPDARRAVIAAYARMEGVFARHGMRRIPSETPVEYLRRLLLGLTSRADAVTRLTGLFERAKFSRHEIDGAMKQDAIDALRAIRDDLQPA